MYLYVVPRDTHSKSLELSRYSLYIPPTLHLLRRSLRRRPKQLSRLSPYYGARYPSKMYVGYHVISLELPSYLRYSANNPKEGYH